MLTEQQRKQIALAWWMLDRHIGDGDDLDEVIDMVTAQTGVPASIVRDLAAQL